MIKTLRGLTFYAVKVDAYCVDQNDNEYLEPDFLALEHETGHELITMHQAITEDTRIFTKLTDAQVWLNKHLNSCSYINAHIVEITFKGGNWHEIV